MRNETQVQQGFQLHSNKSETQETLSDSDKAWLLWETMAEIYANRWVSKNGVAPTAIWITTITTCTGDQLAFIARRCVERCRDGNHWPPDLAEFTALAGEYAPNQLGLSVYDVMNEYWRYAKECWRYESAEKFPWVHPVMYQICPELRREGARRNLSEVELESKAKRMLAKWIKHVDMGFSVPPIRRQIAAPPRADGLTPAQQMLAGKRYVK